MFRLIVLSALVAVAMSQSCCSMEDRKAVLNMWESVWSAEFTGRRVAIAKNAFALLFEKEPSTKDLFTRVNVADLESPEFAAHMIRVINGMDTIINLSFDSDIQAEQLVHLGNQHTKYEGMRADYFRVFREAFSEMLPQAVPCFNSLAWERCLKYMQDKIGSALPN